ncbi:MAG: LemA family protein [Acidimicrobiales bacterium]
MIWPLFVAPLAFVAAWSFDRRRRVYADLGTTPAAAVYAGRNEVKGRAWHETPLSSHLTNTPSVWWTYRLEEERQHTRTVTDTDSEGRTSTRTETYTEWHEIDTKSGAHPSVHVVDDSGAIEVVFADASISPRTLANETFRDGEKKGFLARLVSLDDRTGRYRHTETAIAIGDALFVVGDASMPGDAAVPRIDHGRPFVISTRPEESHTRRAGIAVPIFLAGGVALAIWGAGGIDDPIALPLTIGALALLLLSAVSLTVFNQLQSFVQRAARAWSLIDVQLARRRDLIPALATVARETMAHERHTQETVAVARSSVVGDVPDAATVERADAEVREQTDAIQKLLVVIEDHPELRADTTVHRLQQELADTENRIAGTRAFYNETVTLLRNKRGTFPGVFIARFADPRNFALFGADGFERTVPQVSYDFGDQPQG